MLNGMEIVRLDFVETGTYNDMGLRPYVSNVDVGGVQMLQEATAGGRHLSAASMAGVAGQILRPSATTQGGISIANGWGERRLRFIMEVQSTPFAGGVVVQYLTGYTDHADVTYTRLLDPNMRLYFNNSITCRRATEMTPMGAVSRQALSDASHLLVGHYNPQSPGTSAMTMRPQDVFDTIGASVLDMGTESVHDLRSAFAGESMKKSRRSNGAAPTYLSRLLTTYQTAQAQADGEAAFDDTMSQAASLSRESLMSADKLLHFMRTQTQLQEGGCLTYGELCGLDPRLDSIARVSIVGNAAKIQTHNRGDTEHWNGNMHETVMATILGHSVPAIMLDLMLTKLAFVATNQTLHGGFDIRIVGAMSFAEIDLTPYLVMFEDRLRAEVLTDLSMSNMFSLNLQCEFDVLGESSIQIGLESNPIVPFVIPSFCDALMTPVMTNNSFNLKQIAHDVGSLADNLQVDYSPRNTNYPPAPELRYANPGNI